MYGGSTCSSTCTVLVYCSTRGTTDSSTQSTHSESTLRRSTISSTTVVSRRRTMFWCRMCYDPRAQSIRALHGSSHELSDRSVSSRVDRCLACELTATSCELTAVGAAAQEAHRLEQRGESLAARHSVCTGARSSGAAEQHVHGKLEGAVEDEHSSCGAGNSCGGGCGCGCGGARASGGAGGSASRCSGRARRWRQRQQVQRACRNRATRQASRRSS